MKLDNASQTDKWRKSEATRKVYQSPQLVQYGNVSEITRSVDNMGNGDNGLSPTHKT